MSFEQILACHCADDPDRPYFVLSDLPSDMRGAGAKIYPARARMYAKVLLQVAADCEGAELGHTKPSILEVHKAYDLEAEG